MYTCIGVDPSDSGSGDACGLVAAARYADGTIVLLADQSAPMTSDQRATAAVQLALDVGASEIAREAFAARETYVRVAREALARSGTDRHIRITGWPPLGSQRGKGDAVARSAALLQPLETGTCRLAGHHPRLEDQACGWQAGAPTRQPRCAGRRSRRPGPRRRDDDDVGGTVGRVDQRQREPTTRRCGRIRRQHHRPRNRDEFDRYLRRRVGGGGAGYDPLAGLQGARR